MNRTLDPRPDERAPTTDGRMTVAAVLDTVTIVVFVAVGRRTHEQEPGLAGVFLTAAPFLIALLVGWIALRAWRRPFAPLTGLGVWTVTIVGGMLLRNLVFGDGTASSFVIVAAGFTVACMLGWRAVAGAVEQALRRAR